MRGVRREVEIDPPDGSVRHQPVGVGNSAQIGQGLAT